ncbi:MAG: dihydrofolate reductase [Ignavibacteriae bacterium]|nr:MAG: dihydrofolate reductase [Ignavibacteriota bacterium]
MDWHNVDKEFDKYAEDQLKETDIMVFGRVTYDLMVSYWPTETAMKADPVIADFMNKTPKIVFSRTMDKADWNNTTLIKDNAVEEIKKLKQQPGKRMIIMGSADLSTTFIKNDLIDEYHILLNPVVLGNGHPLFKNVVEKFKLQLISSRAFKNGNVLLQYQTIKE